MITDEILIDRICPKCKGRLCPSMTVCNQCGYFSQTSEERKVVMEIIIAPPLDYLRLYEKECQIDLRKIPQKNRLWGYLAGQVWPVSLSARLVDEYFLAVYALLTPNPEFTPFIGGVKDFHWKLENQEDIEAYGVSGKPIIKIGKRGVWKAIVDIGYAYFILVTTGGFGIPSYAFLKETYQTRLPFENLDRVILTYLIRTKEVFHSGNH